MTGVRGELVRRSQQLACATAHTTVCVSASLRARAIEHGLGAASRLVVLGDGSANGVDLGWLTRTAATDAASAAARAALGIPVTATVLGFVGRVAADKGVAELAAAWAAVRGPDRYLMIVGGPDDTDPVPADVLAALAADPQVRLTGARRDLPAVFGAMELLVLPTRREGFGNVLVEAAAMGVPVVASRTDGCVDAVADGVTGALVPVGDGAALVAALRRYLDDPSRRRAHGAAGRARVEARFDHRLVLGHLAGLYRTMLAARRLPELR
jgi:glycosyltransferase involved in cell wall biosynthesis